MWIGEIDVPSGLISAHREGRLVLFVGAGASIEAPSDLPTFVQLAEVIAGESQHTVTDDDRVHPDRLLGDLDSDGPFGTTDVHLRVADRIGKDTSIPNQLHWGIAALAKTSPQPRIVTTNYDLHLSSP